jgi:hypothetical protein
MPTNHRDKPSRLAGRRDQRQHSPGEAAAQPFGAVPRFCLLQTLLVFGNLDPFKIYKQPGGQADDELTGLRLAGDELADLGSDRRRRQVAKFMRPLVFYWTAKMIAIGAVQFLLLSHQLHHSDRTKWRPPIDWALLHKLEQLIGNPLALQDDVALFFYNGWAGLLLLKLIILPRLLADSKGLNMAAVRFLLAPAIEARRLEASAKQKLTEIENSIRYFTYNLAAIQMQRNPSSCLVPASSPAATVAAHSSLQSSLVSVPNRSVRRPNPNTTRAAGSNKFKMRDSCMRVLALARSLQEGREFRELYLQVIRPEWHRALSEYTAIALPTTIIMFLCWGSSMTFFISQMVGQSHKCANEIAAANATLAASFYRHGLGAAGRCRPFDVMDALFALEIMPIIFTISVMAETLTMFCLSVCVVHQLKLINSMREQLVELSSLLLGGSKTATTSHLDSDSSGTTNNRLILSMIVKLHVFDSELKSGFEDITWQVATFAYHTMSTAILLGLKAHLQTSDSRLISTFILTGTFVWLNMIGLMCSYIHAQYDRLARLYWVVSARLAWIEQRCASGASLEDDRDYAGALQLPPAPGRMSEAIVWATQSSEPCKKIVASSDRRVFDSSSRDCSRIVVGLFHKFLIATGPNTMSYCISPFGVQLTYRHLIEFLFISMLVITLTSNVVGRTGQARLR